MEECQSTTKFYEHGLLNTWVPPLESLSKGEKKMTSCKATLGLALTAVVSIIFIEPVRDFAFNLLIGSVQTMNTEMIAQMPADSPYLESMIRANSLLYLIPLLLTFGGIASCIQYIKNR